MSKSQNSLHQFSVRAQQQIDTATTLQQLDAYRVQFLGKKGEITEQLKRIGSLPPMHRKAVGQDINQIKKQIQAWIATRQSDLSEQAMKRQIAAQSIDVTQPGRTIAVGAMHPVSMTIKRMTDIFDRLGFDIAEGPEVEDDYYNFEALNIPPNHPARALHDTFYVDPHTVLRTHTSPVQIRYMHAHKPPLKVIAPGRVYRCDSDVTHTPMFHQIEGLAIDTDITFAHLKGILIHFVQEFFEKKLEIRLRTSYFPFTEPSAEVDIECVFCAGKGCRVCGQSGWLEILGCGMVHPEVLRHGGIDEQKFTGYAFGLGVERLAMLRYSVNDLRLFFDNDLAFLRHFR